MSLSNTRRPTSDFDVDDLEGRLRAANTAIARYDSSPDIRLARFASRVSRAIAGETMQRRLAPTQLLPRVCVVVFGKTAENIERCLLSILRQDYPSDRFEVIALLPPEAIALGENEWWASHPRIQLRSTESHPQASESLAAAVLAAADFSSAELISPIRPTDILEPAFLRILASGVGPNIEIVIGPVSHRYASFGDTDPNTKSQTALGALPLGVLRDPAGSLEQFETGLGKMFRASSAATLLGHPQLSEAADLGLVEWSLALCARSGAIIVRRAPANSAYQSLQTAPTRVESENEVEQITAAIEKLDAVVFDGDLRWDEKSFAIAAASQLNRRLKNSIDRTPATQRRSSRAKAFESRSFLINRAALSERHAIAFCQGFPPYSDASSITASQRLGEISAREGGPLRWNVVTADMGNRFTRDEHYRTVYADFHTASIQVAAPIRWWNERDQLRWSQQAAAFAYDEPAEIIYSRSMQPGSHLAAYKYKRAHPTAKWYAEFSDPLSLDSTGEPRSVSRAYTGDLAVLNDFWLKLERTVFQYADTIIFPNHHQMPHMLDHACPPELRPAVEAKSIVMLHPQIDNRYTSVDPSNLQLPPEKWNVGYFGTFYASPSTDDTIERILSNPQVHLHLFTSTSGDVSDLIRRFPDQITRRAPQPYLQFLNLASRMDYLLLIHRPYPGDRDPYITSKWSDYETAGRPIISETPVNSPLVYVPGAERHRTVDAFLEEILKRDKTSSETYAHESALAAYSAPDAEALLDLRQKVNEAESRAGTYLKFPVPFVREIFRNTRQRLAPAGDTLNHGISGAAVPGLPCPIPSITAVMATYQPTPWIDDAITSVLGQEYPADSLRILIAHNGSDLEWLETLRQRWANEPRIRIVHTEKKGLAAAQNLATQELESEWLLKLDDDDMLSPRYVFDLAQHARRGVSIVLGRLENMHEDGLSFIRNTYLTRSIEIARSHGDRALAYSGPGVASHFSSLAAKLMKVEHFRSRFGPIDEDVPHSEDSLFWIENAHLLSGRITTVDPSSPEAYYRRMTAGSLSRPDEEREYAYRVSDRIMLIERCAQQITAKDRPLAHRQFVAQKCVTQNQFMQEYYDRADERLQSRIRSEVFASRSHFVNQSLFSDIPGLIVSGETRSGRQYGPEAKLGRLLDVIEAAGAPVAWSLSVFDVKPARWKESVAQAFLVPFMFRSHTVSSLPSTRHQEGFESFIRSKYDIDGIPSVILTLGARPEFHSHAAGVRAFSPEMKWIAVAPPASRVELDSESWRDIFSNADIVVTESQLQRETIERIAPPVNPNRTIAVIEPRGLPEWYRRIARESTLRSVATLLFRGELLRKVASRIRSAIRNVLPRRLAQPK